MEGTANTTDDGDTTSVPVQPEVDSSDDKQEHDVSVTVEDEENDKAPEEKDKEEKKDVEEPLLDGDEIKIDIEKGGNDEKSVGGDTPTLPLPEYKKSKKDSIDAKDEVEKPPSIFLFPIARIRYSWENSQNLTEFFTKAICIIFASLGWLFLVGGIPFLSIAQLIIGSIFLHDCPVEPRIPEYLIVAGFFGTLLHIVAVVTKYAPKDAKGIIEAQRRRCLMIEALLQIFLFIWFVAGSVWVYNIYEPDYIFADRPEYCHKTLYLFTFWMFNIAFIFLASIISIGICCIVCIAAGSSR